MKSLERVKIVYNPEEKVHTIYGMNSFFLKDSDKLYEDWEPWIPIEKCSDWKELLIELIEFFLEQDA